MKRVLWIAVLILFFAGCRANAFSVIGGMNGHDAAGVTYSANESFNPTGYDLTWSETAGTPNEDYTTSPAPLAGAQSLYLGACAATAAQTTKVSFTSTATYDEAYLLINFPTVSTAHGQEDYFAFFDNSSDQHLAYYEIRTLAGVQYFGVQGATSGGLTLTTSSMSPSTTYHVWVRYTKGTGADATASIAFSTNGVRPTSGNNYAESTGGSYTVNAAKLVLSGIYGASDRCVDVIMDHVLVNSSAPPIGDNP